MTSIVRYGKSHRMCQSVRQGSTLYLSGQVADLQDALFETQFAEVLDKVENVLIESGSNKSNLLSIQIVLADIGDYHKANVIYDRWLNQEGVPARACYEARLAYPSLKVEVIAVACVPDSSGTD